MARRWASRLAIPFAFSRLLSTAYAQSASADGSLISSEFVTAIATATTTASDISAQTTDITSTATGSGATSSPTLSGPQVHLVKVGSGGFKFEPNELKDVAKGDTITFEFYPKDHSVARAEYESACVPYEYTGKNKVGFWSQTQWVDTVDDITHWNLTINNTEPIFFYCAAPGSCIDEIMVGAINPNGTQTLDAQIRSAKQASFQVAPGEAIPKEGSATLQAPAATGSQTSAPAPSSDSHKLSAGAIAGIVVGAVAFLVICAALFFYVGRTKSLKEVIKRRDATVTKGGSPSDAAAGHFGPHSSGFPGPFSPTQNHAEYGSLPAYGQHHVGEQYPSGWGSPAMRPGHMSTTSATSQPQMSEAKHTQAGPIEMSSPPPGQQTFTAELEAPIKAAR